MVERNAGLPPDRRIEFRVGIHLGSSLCAPTKGGSTTLVHRGLALRQSRRRPGTEVFRRWRDGELNHRSFAHRRIIRDRAQHGVYSQNKLFDVKQIGRELNVHYVSRPLALLLAETPYELVRTRQ
jgi:hypothetical protein